METCQDNGCSKVLVEYGAPMNQIRVLIEVRNIWGFSPPVPSKQEKNILVFLSLYIF